MILLGSTGSIGQNTLEIARKYRLKVKALAAHSNTELLNRQIEEFKPDFVALGDVSKIDKINHKKVFAGDYGILEMIETAFGKDEILVNAIVGFAGLAPTLNASKLGYKIALANKESLVAAGEFLDTSNIIPIDSEHFGLKYLLGGKKPKKLIITASGGSFRDTHIELLPQVSLNDALKHPNWKMGKKITIDSATMMNKLFEILEAKWLFNSQNIDAIIETKSLIHALVEFEDGSTTAHIANADMKLPIAFALLGNIEENILPNVDLTSIKNIEFKEIKTDRYPVWQLRRLLLEKSHLGVVLNAANEVAVEFFLKNKIAFTKISECVLRAVQDFENAKARDIKEVFDIDRSVRHFCIEFFGGKK